MGGGGFTSLVLTAAREALRAQKAAERRAAAAAKQYNRELILEYIEREKKYAASLSADIRRELDKLKAVLPSALVIDHHVDFELLESRPSIPPFDPMGLDIPEPLPDPEDFAVPPLGWIASQFASFRIRHNEKEQAARDRYQDEVAVHSFRESQRCGRLHQLRLDYESRVADVLEEAGRQHRHIDALRTAFEAGDPDAIVEYFKIILERTTPPLSPFGRSRLSYLPDSRTMVVRLQLPVVSIVPAVDRYTYVKSRDEIKAHPRSIAKVRSTYQDVICRFALRTVHVLFQADRGDLIEAVSIEGFSEGQSPETGLTVESLLLRVKTTRITFTSLEFNLVEPIACVKSLAGEVLRPVGFVT